MQIIVNETTLNVVNAYAEREQDIKLYIHVPYSEIEYSNLKLLFKNNIGDILKVSDAGVTEEIYSGFSYVNILDDDETNVYIVTLVSSENEFQIGRNRRLEAKIASLTKENLGKDSTIGNLQGAILEMEEEILQKNNSIQELDEQILKLEQDVNNATNNAMELVISEMLSAIKEGVNDV